MYSALHAISCGAVALASANSYRSSRVYIFMFHLLCTAPGPALGLEAGLDRDTYACQARKHIIERCILAFKTSDYRMVNTHCAASNNIGIN